jgi:hypothetical protein
MVENRFHSSAAIIAISCLLQLSWFLKTARVGGELRYYKIGVQQMVGPRLQALNRME